MPKIDLRQALAEAEERQGDLCRSCNAPAEEGWEPHCASCGSYWRDADEGLYQDD
ncbi:hypothetical protein rosmuc_03045 [Roseovarius mucosus DSM 17069]|uniref:Uncharacterized protein n=1 Tax=Roseovarius mucosus DSM 17069 TaxID=1288298 RepID=A0A0A0HG60_9RHOB|nr:hypothetical protein rosmuc_03045 [Roseovarius mucosus DSM 17069]